MTREAIAEQRGTVFKLNGRWQCRWFDEDGIRRSKTFKLQREAQDYLDKTALPRVRAKLAGDSDVSEIQTVDALLDAFEDGWGTTVDPSTLKVQKRRLKYARDTFGSRRPSSLRKGELEDWRQGLPQGSRHDIFRCFRQALLWGFDRGLVVADSRGKIPTDGVDNPRLTKRERTPVTAFASWDEIDRLTDEMDHRYAPLVILMAALGLRPEEALALHLTAVDLEAGELAISRRYTDGQLKEGLKRKDSDGGAEDGRVVPFDQGSRAEVAILEAKARAEREESELLFPAPRGGYINLDHFRNLEWEPALRAAGLPHHRIYDLRTSFITWAESEGVSYGAIAEFCGTSIEQISRTYSRPDRGELRNAFAKVDGRGKRASLVPLEDGRRAS